MDRYTNRYLCLLLAAAVCLATANHGRCEESPPLPWVKGSTTVAVMPDTERYSDDYPKYFEAQTKWVAENHKTRNIAYTVHLGDITQHNAPAEWEVAKRCFKMLDGRVPYVLTLGNHDYDDNAPKRDTSRLTKYFPLEAIRKWPTFGGIHAKGKLDNSYHLLSIGGRGWIILSLECGPRNEVVEWANKVLARHSDRLAIFVTHAYLFRNNVRYDHTKGKQRASPHGWGNDGEELWQKLVRRHRNMMIVLSGHVSTGGLGYLASEADYGNTVHQMMVDYEKMRGGGQAYMRLLEFLPDGKTVQVRTYSPALKRTRRSKLEEFTYKLKPADRKTPRRADALRSARLSKAPIHRYSFDGTGGDKAKINDSVGTAHGVLRAHGTDSKLNGAGQAVLSGDGCVELPPKLLAGLKDISFEVWFTPTADRYNWKSVVRFGSRDDWLTYTFRTLTVHRAEIAVNRHNEDIQQTVPIKPGKPLHVVVTYDHDGAGGKPQLSYYRDGKLLGKMRTGLLLGDVEDTANRVGPFTGKFDELRVYGYPLTLPEVQGNFEAGPSRVQISK